MVLGVLLPLAAAALGRLPAREIAGEIGRAALVLLGLWTVALFATLRSADHIKARVRAIVGLLHITLAFIMLDGAIREHDQKHHFADQIFALGQRSNSDAEALVKRYAKLPLDAVLAAETLVSANARMTAKATLAQARALIAEGAALRQKYDMEFQRIIAAQPTEELRRGAAAGRAARHADNARQANELDAASYAVIDAQDAILAWCEQQGDSLSLAGQQLLVSDTQAAQFNALQKNLRTAMWHEENLDMAQRRAVSRAQQTLDELKGELGSGRPKP